MNSYNIHEYNEREYNSELMHNINDRLKENKLHLRTNSSNFRSIFDSRKRLMFSFMSSTSSAKNGNDIIALTPPSE